MSILLLIFKTVIDLAIKLSLSGKEPPSGNKNSFCDLPKTVALLVVFPDICIVKRPARKGGTLFEVNSYNFIISVKGVFCATDTNSGLICKNYFKEIKIDAVNAQKKIFWNDRYVDLLKFDSRKLLRPVHMVRLRLQCLFRNQRVA